MAMIWIWLATRHAYQWATGPLDRYFAFVCAACGVSTPAMVRSFGHGSGRSHMAAEGAAHASASAFAYRAVAAASCPHCCALQPSLYQQFEAATKKAARNRMLRLPLAAAAAVVMAILVGIPAVRDLRHSVMLTVVATSAAAAVGALFFAIFAGAVQTPSTNPSGVWFSRDPQVPNTWFPAQPGNAPVVPQPEKVLRIVSLVTMGVTVIAALVALVLWSETFRKVYVVSAEGPGRSLSVRVDGGESRPIPPSATDDAPNIMFEVRTSSLHHIAVTGADGRHATYELDPATAKHGWIVAPHARERGLCVTSIKWFYGTKPTTGKNDDTLLAQAGDVIVLPHSFDHVFTAPPATVQVQNGSSETRTSVRALDCDALEREEHVPFKDARHVAATP
jgi:hypothetical protein